jgi:hypothetical protein
MMIGCCYCGEQESESTPSESLPPSESVSESVSESDSGSLSESESTFYFCTSCIDQVAPLRYKATIGYTGTTATNGKCCSVYNQSVYYLTNVPGTCRWESAEIAHAESNLGTLECTEGTGAFRIARVELELTGTHFRLYYKFLYPTSGPSIIRLLWRIPASPASPINCLAAHTLNYQSEGGGVRWSGLAPCRTTQSIPATVSVEPA